jgi:hypothetical protein
MTKILANFIADFQGVEGESKVFLKNSDSHPNSMA